VEELHGKGIMGEPGDGEKAEIPEGWMTFMTFIEEEFRKRAAVASDQPGVELIPPHLMVEERKKRQDKENSNQN